MKLTIAWTALRIDVWGYQVTRKAEINDKTKGLFSNSGFKTSAHQMLAPVSKMPDHNNLGQSLCQLFALI